MTRIRVLGHSLGGALATICAADIRYNCYQRSKDFYKPSVNGSIVKISCRSFGSPAIGDENFTNFFNNEVRDSIRYAIKYDPVTICLSPFQNYAHVAHYLEMADLIGKHKIEYYIGELEKWHETRRISEISVEDEDVMIIDGKNDDSPNLDPNFLFCITIFLLVAVVFTKYKKSLI